MKPYILVSSQNMYSYDYYLKSIYLYRYKTTQQYILEEKKETNDLKTICKRRWGIRNHTELACSVLHTFNCYPWSDY